MQKPLPSLHEFSNLTREEEKHAFLKVLAHELRNPLATILSSIELIKEIGADAETTPELLKIVEDRVRVITNILNDLLGTTRIPPLQTTQSTGGGTETLGDEPSALDSQPAPLRTIVVDDNKTAADSLGQLLTLRGYDVVVAYSGREALKEVLLFQPQVAILDIGMPEMDGYELAGLLRAQNFPCTYIALTGYGQTHDRQQADLAGFDYHLTKPAALKEIEAILQKIEDRI